MSTWSSHTSLGKLLNPLSTGSDLLWLEPGCFAPEVLGELQWLSLGTPAASVARLSGEGDAELSSRMSRNGQAKDRAEGVKLGTASMASSRWRLVERKEVARDEARCQQARGTEGP